MNIDDLRPGDLIISYKKPKWWQIFQRIFSFMVKYKSIKLFGRDCVIPEATHVRTVCGRGQDIMWCFEWTAPVAKFSAVEPWMILPDYARVYRPLAEHIDPFALDEFFKLHNGDFYDVGELFDIWFETGNLFGWGDKLYVCSVGARHAQERVVFGGFITDLKLTPPCLFANLPNKYTLLNTDAPRMKLIPERIAKDLIDQ